VFGTHDPGQVSGRPTIGPDTPISRTATISMQSLTLKKQSRATWNITARSSSSESRSTTSSQSAWCRMVGSPVW